MTASLLTIILAKAPDMPLSSEELQQCQKEMERIALEAGKVIRSTFFQEDKQVTIKNGDSTDLVTETDKWVEDFVRNELHAFRPDWQFIGEESSKADVVIPNEPVWIIDPIDGTTNFVHRFPEIGVSIALVEEGISVAGVIYNPVKDHLLSAVKGHGCFLNGKTVNIDTKNTALDKSLIITHFSNMGNRPQRFEQLNFLLDIPVHGLRFVGCATAALGYVATGVADAYFERGLKAWDVAAGAVIIREAGGIVMDYSGSGKLDLSRRECLAARNLQIATELLDLLNKNS